MIEVEDSELKSRVRVLLDERKEKAESLMMLGEENIQLDTDLDVALRTAIHTCMGYTKGVNIRRAELDLKVSFADPEGAEGESDTIVLEAGCFFPIGYIQLIEARNQFWNHKVTNSSDMDSDTYRKQSNPYTKSGTNKPVAIENGNGGLYLFPLLGGKYSITYDAEYDTPWDEDKHDAPYITARNEGIANGVVYMTASLIYTQWGMRELAAEMQKAALIALGVRSNN